MKFSSAAILFIVWFYCRGTICQVDITQYKYTYDEDEMIKNADF